MNRITFILGSSIEEAVTRLLKFKKAGISVYGKFNGVTLYSDTVTMDSAHQEIIGMSKAEFDKSLK